MGRTGSPGAIGVIARMLEDGRKSEEGQRIQRI
jgi:hypothetical protein